MKLKKALELHHASAVKGSLARNFGDGYLLRTSPVYASIRKSALRLGYRYTTDRLYHYDALALSQIHRLIRDRRIPYIDNVSVLEEIEELRPGMFSWADIPDLKRNVLLHESAHCVARASTHKWFPEPSRNERILSMLLEESYANTCDSVVGAGSSREAHRIFSHLNCYTLFEEKSDPHGRFREMRAMIGERAVFQTTLLLYLHANFLCENFDEQGFAELLQTVLKQVRAATGKTVAVNRRDLKKLYRYLSFPFLLNLYFRYRTNDFYFRLLGFKGKVENLLAFDHIAYVSGSEAFWGCLNELTDLALVGPDRRK